MTVGQLVTPRQLRAERILDAAAELLLRLGYKRVTVEDVAERAGTGKGTLYLHWPTREALFCAVIERELVGAVTDLVVAMRTEPEASLPGQLLRTHFLLVMSRPLCYARCSLRIWEILGKLIKSDEALQAQLRRGFREYVQQLATHQLLRAGMTVDEALYIFRAAATGFFVSEQLGGPDVHLSLERQADLLGGIIRLAIEVDRPAPVVTGLFAQRAIDIFSAIAEQYRSSLQNAYEYTNRGRA